MEYDYQVSRYFLFLLDLCRSPDQVFCENTLDLKVAKAWQEKLCRYVCEDLNDRRLRNVYLSYLIVALNDAHLNGPFLYLPSEGKLEAEVDFEAEGAVKDMEAKDDPDYKPKEKVTIEEPTKENAEGAEGAEGAAAAEPAPPEATTAAYTQVYHDIFTDMVPHSTSNASVQLTEENKEETRELIHHIDRELCGRAQPGVNDILERELMRYAEFLQHFPSMRKLEGLKLDPENRNLMLQSLKMDMIQLLEDNRLPEEETENSAKMQIGESTNEESNKI